MYNYKIYDGEKVYIRVNKTTAKRLYEKGEDIIISPCKFRPNHPYGLSIQVNKSYWDNVTFKQLVDNYTIFNCRDNETGRYPAYYRIVENLFSQKRIPD